MEFPYAQPFSVRDFLRSLLGDQSLEKIMAYTLNKPNTRMWRNSETASFKNAFNGGNMNFTHFMSTRLQLGVSMSDLLHSLLRQQAALQLAFGQPAWDILIPVYYGNLTEEFNPARASAILIQVKNRDRPFPFSLEEHLHHYTSFFHTNDPILYILMNLGTSDNVVGVRSFPRAKALALPKNSALLKQHIFGMHLAGVDGTFACLQDPRLLM